MVTHWKIHKSRYSFWTDSTYEKYLIAALLLAGDFLRKAELEYNGKFGHNIG